MADDLRQQINNLIENLIDPEVPAIDLKKRINRMLRDMEAYAWDRGYQSGYDEAKATYDKAKAEQPKPKPRKKNEIPRLIEKPNGNFEIEWDAVFAEEELG